MRTRLTILAAVLLAGLAACNNGSDTSAAGPGGGSDQTTGSDQTGGGGGGSVDVCSLLTVDEASAVLGHAAAAGVESDNSGLFQCQWAGNPGSIAVLVTPNVNWDLAVSVAKNSSKYQELSLGDAAYTTGFDINVRKGTTGYHIGVIGTSDNVQAAITVAQDVLGRV